YNHFLGRNGVRQLQALVDKKRVIVTESSIRRDLHLDDAEGTDCLPTATIFEELARMGYEKPSQKLTFYKAFFSPQWMLFISFTITQCLSAKSTAWNEFSSSMASLIICLATNQKFNLSKYIFDAMVKHLDGGVKFLMYPRFLQVFINHQLAKDAQAQEIATLKKRIQRLERKKMSRPIGLKRLRKVGMTRRVESSEDQESLGAPEDASKQGRISGDVKCVEVRVDGKRLKLSTTADDSSMLVKHCYSAATTQLLQEPKLIFGVVVSAKKDQIALDEQIARDIQAKLDAKLIEEQKLARKQEEEANIALIELWENTQAMMEADRLLAERLQSREREELTDKEKQKLFMDLMEKRRVLTSASGVNEPRHYTRRNASASTRRTSTSTTLYDESEEDSVDEDDIVDIGNDGEIRNENLDDYFEQK
ncbi:hypothetical protein Tco_0403503, partial [Tanacetum coccineum]